MIDGNSFSVDTVIFQCEQCVLSRVNLETPKRTWTVFLVFNQKPACLDCTENECSPVITVFKLDFEVLLLLPSSEKRLPLNDTFYILDILPVSFHTLHFISCRCHMQNKVIKS